jgi:hypothetical protein
VSPALHSAPAAVATAAVEARGPLAMTSCAP